jgi:hypothetical protein
MIEMRNEFHDLWLNRHSLRSPSVRNSDEKMRRRLLFNNKKCNKNDQSHQKTQEIPYEIEKGLSF